jgi:hypothetical protein
VTARNKKIAGLEQQLKHKHKAYLHEGVGKEGGAVHDNDLREDGSHSTCTRQTRTGMSATIIVLKVQPAQTKPSLQAPGKLPQKQVHKRGFTYR